MKLVTGNKNYSSWSLRPWLLCRHFGLEFVDIPVSLDPSRRRERLLDYSAAAKVPVLIDDELTVWDSLAICEYLSERYLDGDGWPFDVAERALARSLAAEMHSGFTALRNEMPMNIRARRRIQASEAALADVARIDEIWSDCLATFSHRGPWLFGGFSVADAMYAPVAMRFKTYEPQLSPQAQAYIDTVSRHPAMVEWCHAALAETEIIDEDEAGQDRDG